MKRLPSIAVLVATASAVHAAPTTRPNVVILVADDLGSADVGWRGGEVKTPNLDALASAGAKLEQHYVQPVCSPTRAALMTGRYPFRYGMQVGVVKPWADYGLPLDERTLPQALRDVGYETAIVGKWHLGHARPEFLPLRRGFEHQYGHYNGALDYFTHQRDGGHDWHRDDKPNYDEGYSTTLLANEAVRLIEHRDKARPLFLYVPFNAVHGPYQVPDSYKLPYADVQRPRRLAYMGMLAAMDEAVGRITASLKQQGIAGDTLVLFSSDNGGPQPGVVTRNGDLRAGKGTVYEGGVRVVATATWPGVIPANSAVNAPTHIVDWYATLLRLGAATLDQPKPLDGQDILPLLKGEATAGRAEVVINVTPSGGAIRAGDWKLVINGERHIAEEADAPETPTTRPSGVALFDLAADRGETRDVAAARPDVVARLRARFDQLSRQAAQPLSEARDPTFKSPKIWGQPD